MRDAPQGIVRRRSGVVLSDVLARMQGHQAKKNSRLRALNSWSHPHAPIALGEWHSTRDAADVVAASSGQHSKEWSGEA
jgi:hypothetical protein